jgi:HK97 family phage portal protein
MRTAAVYACVRVISEAIASLPLRLYRFENGLVPEPDNTLYDILHTSPNSEMTSFVFRETLMSHILLYGNGYAQILRDGLDRITALYPLLPNKMDVCRNPDNGQIFYTYWRDRDETRSHEKSGGVALRKEEVLHIPGLSFDGLVGYSPIALAKNAIGMAIATEDYGASFFANGANPGGVLEHPGTLKDATALRATWEALYKGAKNSHRIAVLEEGLKFHTIGIPPEQAQFLETRKFQLNEIARVFRVPPHMIGDLEKSTFSNIEQQSMEFVKYTLDPWVVRLEQSMNQTLLSPSERKKYVVKFNLDGLLRGDYATRMNGYAIGRQNGWLSANDIRKLEDLNPISAEDGGDRYLVNGNMVDLKNAGAAYGEAGK